MKLKTALLLLALMSFSASVFAKAPTPDAAIIAAVKALKQQFPKFDWRADTAIYVDINGDGIKDIAVMGYTKDTGAVGVVLGQKGAGASVAKYLDFDRCDSSSERAMNGCKATLKASKQSDEVKEILGELPEGYKICDDCYEIVVAGDEESDPIVIYWNYVSNDLNWWRA